MFMKDNKNKGIAALIIAKKKKPDDSEPEIQTAPKNEEGMNTDYEMGIDTALDDVMSALDSKNKASLKSAMKSLVTMIIDEQEDLSRSNPEE